MDDWLSVIYRGGLFSFCQRIKKEKLFRHLIDAAVARFAICQAMADAYFLRYGQPFLPFQNTIDTHLWQHFQNNSLVVGSPVRVAYIGSILPFAQLESLCDCCKAIQELSDDGLPILLDIYSPLHLSEQYRGKLVVGSAISLQDTITDDQFFFSTIQSVDILILPVNFDAYTIDFIRYSMPTKIPAYLTVGTPILVYGPQEVAQISYASSVGWGLVVNMRNITSLKFAFCQLITDNKLRHELSERARATAVHSHDANTVRAEFQTAILKAANLYPSDCLIE